MANVAKRTASKALRVHFDKASLDLWCLQLKPNVVTSHFGAKSIYLLRGVNDTRALAVPLSSEDVTMFLCKQSKQVNR